MRRSRRSNNAHAWLASERAKLVRGRHEHRLTARWPGPDIERNRQYARMTRESETGSAIIRRMLDDAMAGTDLRPVSGSRWLREHSELIWVVEADRHRTVAIGQFSSVQSFVRGQPPGHHRTPPMATFINPTTPTTGRACLPARRPCA